MLPRFFGLKTVITCKFINIPSFSSPSGTFLTIPNRLRDYSKVKMPQFVLYMTQSIRFKHNLVYTSSLQVPDRKMYLASTEEQNPQPHYLNHTD